MPDFTDVKLALAWLLSGNADAIAIMTASQLLTLTMGVFALAAAMMLLLTWRSSRQREIRTRQMIDEDRKMYRLNRI